MVDTRAEVLLSYVGGGGSHQGHGLKGPLGDEKGSASGGDCHHEAQQDNERNQGRKQTLRVSQWQSDSHVAHGFAMDRDPRGRDPVVPSGSCYRCDHAGVCGLRQHLQEHGVGSTGEGRPSRHADPNHGRQTGCRAGIGADEVASRSLKLGRVRAARDPLLEGPHFQCHVCIDRPKELRAQHEDRDHIDGNEGSDHDGHGCQGESSPKSCPAQSVHAIRNR